MELPLTDWTLKARGYKDCREEIFTYDWRLLGRMFRELEFVRCGNMDGGGIVEVKGSRGGIVNQERRSDDLVLLGFVLRGVVPSAAHFQLPRHLPVRIEDDELVEQNPTGINWMFDEGEVGTKCEEG